MYHLLKNLARKKHRFTQELLQYYAMERFLYRLSVSEHRDKFFLKGGLMLLVWDPNGHRATRDIDLLGKTANSIAHLHKVLEDICTCNVLSDGLVFDPGTIVLAEAQKQAEYTGVSATLLAKLFTANLHLRVDFGFNDTILPKPATITYPTLLDFPAPHLRGYTPQTVIAEKFEALIKLSLANTRMKDFYDLWTLTRQFDFDYQQLRQIIHQVCTARKTEVTANPEGLSDEFHLSPVTQIKWQAFMKDLPHEPVSLETVIHDLRRFFEKVLL